MIKSIQIVIVTTAYLFCVICVATFSFFFLFLLCFFLHKAECTDPICFRRHWKNLPFHLIPSTWFHHCSFVFSAFFFFFFLSPSCSFLLLVGVGSVVVVTKTDDRFHLSIYMCLHVRTRAHCLLGWIWQKLKKNAKEAVVIAISLAKSTSWERKVEKEVEE